MISCGGGFLGANASFSLYCHHVVILTEKIREGAKMRGFNKRRRLSNAVVCTGWSFQCGLAYCFRRAHRHISVHAWLGIWPKQSAFYLCISAISARRRSISSFSEAICLRRNCSMASSSSCSVKISFSCNDQLVHSAPCLYALWEHGQGLLHCCALGSAEIGSSVTTSRRGAQRACFELSHLDLKPNPSSKPTLPALIPQGDRCTE